MDSNVSFASLPLFVPTIISEMGSFSRITSNGLSAPPYVLCFFVIIILCWLSDRTKMRGPFVALAATVAAIGFIINATTTTTAPRYTSIFLSVNIFASVALLLAWTANMHTNESKRGGGYTILATIGQLGPILGKAASDFRAGNFSRADLMIGTNVFPASEGPYYRKGLWISAAMCLMVAALATTLSLWIIYDNRKIDRQQADLPEDGFDTDLGEQQGRRVKHKGIW